MTPVSRPTCKAAATVSPDDFRGLRAMAAATGRRFHRGVFFYLGATAVAVSPQLYAPPASCIVAIGR